MRPIIVERDKMSGPERKHADALAMWKAAGEIIDYIYETIQFNLAKKTTYEPDFFVTFPDHFEVHEVKQGIKERIKGKWTGRYIPLCRGDECLTKLKICARIFPHWKFRLYWYYSCGMGMREIEP